MIRINKVYTRGGDGGETSLIGGKRVRKDCPRITVCGQVDELNAFMGWAAVLAQARRPEPAAKAARSEAPGMEAKGPPAQLAADLCLKLKIVQNELFDLGCSLASSPANQTLPTATITSTQVERLESWIEQGTKILPELTSFVLPGGGELNAVLHVCRAVCRRTERSAVKLDSQEPIPRVVLMYLNRLSDWLFVAARQAAKECGAQELLWQPGRG